ncbi:MAG TPA: transcription elongation factor GreB [Aliidongia sp.]|uniref:transcription elongation factor GreB n=1 Tax=Aliidongia sp. TaxID=1914230 RepID=UPI002DDCFAA5|nr:transcription elongation factor GreB [Aliidongia sp.]HEV2678008.1 transcription elongation factor GreB [Aliidongia sp.]
MSKAFTKETETDEAEELPDEPEPLPPGTKNYMTPVGFKRLWDEREFLVKKDRPKVVEVVSWAAGNGDRSENGDYLYGKKRLREIDRRLRFLTKRLEAAEVVDPKRQQGLRQIFFGATVTYANGRDEEMTVTLVGVDEADMERGQISWISPVARALMKARVGDTVEVKTPAGPEPIEVLDIEYRLPADLG